MSATYRNQKSSTTHRDCLGGSMTKGPVALRSRNIDPYVVSVLGVLARGSV